MNCFTSFSNLLAHLFILTLSLFTIISCSSQKEAAETTSTSVKSSVQLVESFAQYRSASVNIETLDLHENTLYLNISYSGGCEDHEFILLGLKELSQEDPPKRKVQLYHNNNGDNCRELITQKLKLDISKFGLENGQAVILDIQGWKNPVTYYLKK